MSKKNLKRKKKNTILNLLMAICACLFAFSAYKLINYYFEYKSMDAVYANISEQVVGNFVYEPDSEGLLKKAPEIDLSHLQEINDEVIGYIIIPNSKISYPIVHSNEPLKYLNYDVQLNRSRAGAIFTDVGNHPDFSDNNTIIYGHNMFDGSMFSDIGKYVDDKDFFNEHAYIYIYTNNEIRLYRVFASLITEETSDVYTLNFGSEESYLNYIQTNANASSVPARIIPSGTPPLITLSTCRHSSGPERNVALAYLVDTLPNNE